MKNINETMSKYTAGEITLEQANEALAKAEVGFHLLFNVFSNEV